MRAYNSIIIAATIVIAVLATGCSQSDATIQSAIPANTSMVTRLNVSKVIDAMGGKMQGGKVTLPENVSEMMMLGNKVTDVLNNMGALADAIDINNVYHVKSFTNAPYFIAEVKDADALAQVLTDKLGYKNDGSKGVFDAVFTGAGTTVLMRGNLCWIVDDDAQRAVEGVATELKVANDNSFDKVPTVAEELSSADDSDMMVVAKMTNINSHRWHVIEAEAEGANLILDITTIDKEGNEEKIQGLTEIQLDFLRYVPGDYNVALAMGVTNAFDWKGLFGMSENVDNFKVNGFIEQLKPFLAKADGTVAIAMKMPESQRSTDEFAIEWPPFVAMIHMSQADMNESLSAFGELLRKNYMTVSEMDNGLYRAAAGEATALYYGAVDGYMAVSTQPLEPNKQNSLTQTFQGKKIAGVARLSTLQFVMPTMKNGIDLSLEGGDSEFTLILRPTTQGTTAMGTLMTLISLM